MPKRKKSGGRSTPTQAALVDARLDRILDGIDAAVLGGAPERAHALVEDLAQAPRRLPEVLTRRLISGRAKVPILAFELLSGYAGERAGSYLLRIAERRGVPDIVRWGARRRAGWPEGTESADRLAFLETLEDPDGTLVVAASQGSDRWPPQGEILEEVLEYLTALPSARRRAAVERMVAELGPRIAVLLHALLHVADLPTQRLTLDALVRLRAPGAADPIGRLARTTDDARLRADAEAAAQRLRLQVVDRDRPPEPPTMPPIERAHLSLVDGAGGQIILVVRRAAEGVLLFGDVFHDEASGIKSAFGSTRADPSLLEEIIGDLEDAGIELVEADLSAVRGALAGALEVNVAHGLGVPPVFELWEPLLHDTYPPPRGEPVTAPILDDAPYGVRRDLVRRGGELVAHPFFASWGFDPRLTLAATVVAPPPTGARLTDRQYRPMIGQLVGSEVQARLRQRLRRQAWVLERAGDTTARDLALASAAHLGKADRAELVRQPFLRALVERSTRALVGAYLEHPDPDDELFS